jgi:Tfp pilus assembly protein PilP
MKAVVLLAMVASVVGCSRRGDPQGDAAAKAVQPREAAAAARTGSLAPDWWEARSEFPAQKGSGFFEGHELNVPIQRRPPPVRPADPLAPGPAGPPPPPLAYVGKVARDGEGYAVLVRDERVYMVGVGDAVGNGYRVQSISEKEVVILNVDFRLAHTLPFSASAPNAVLPQSGARAADEPPPDGEPRRD